MTKGDIDMDSKINILGINFNCINMKQAVNQILEYFHQEGVHMVFTPNPEIVMLAQKDFKFNSILNQADLIVPDGIGIVKAAKILKTPLPERVAGYDLVQNVFEEIKGQDKSVFFLGGAPNVAEMAAVEMRKKYPGLNIVGVKDGYFKEEEEKKIVECINQLKPDLLLVGLGAPKQEKWIYKYRKSLRVKVCIGVGGSFDVMSGQIKRAPQWMIRLHLEWFYRLLKQPSRIKRMLFIPIFMAKVVKNR
jgi:N-acetylglucosaminyldiphosphoundecaprenol N-acetyl-beta-D-mannosaminyltransferase